ncbi:MAG: LPS-assembly protein LptD [Sulfurovum sp.]|uniref:LPS-assembly protein LptD n=1 Tax=Sulfurovum sp. TaxID=1969726 RepID=UPI0028680F99|nr:LPS-assembly protein LptD [Sulfurovum sp.]MCO4845691.1 LPS-assembly protein LptD [Sulfurovum sp.]
MTKNIFFFLVAIVVGVQILSAASDKSKIEITAKQVEATKNVIRARENVIVYYEDSVIKASSAHFDKSTKVLLLDGKIEMIGYEGSKVHTDHLEIHTDTKEVTFDELFLIAKNDVWIFSNDAHKEDANYTLGASVLSSCDIEDPLWKMVFSRSSYDSEADYIKMYGAKVYLWDIPMFYTPYLAFSTNKKRTSGLLFPGFGYSSNEGFLYEQPIYWAISPSMDMEFNPQIRTSRSVGMYSTLRFVDSAYSSGELRVGYFKDKTDYIEDNYLRNDSHYGIEFNYESSKVFSDKLPQGFTDGLYINTTYLNDIDYLNLQNSNLEHFGLVPLQESRVNYFAYNNDFYTGLNAKYFIDTRKEDNDDTLQILPSVQLHKYLNHLIWDNLTYSADLRINNLYRQKGTTLRQAALKVPLEFTTSFFDDFLNLSLGEEIYYSKFFFGNEDYLYDDFEYYSNIHKVKLFTDLTKKFDSFIHVLQPSFTYIKPGSEHQSPAISSLDVNQTALFTVGLPEEHYAFSLSQYFYDENMKLKFFQRFTQRYYLDRSYELADMSNEMQYNWDQWNLYNNTTYSHEYGKIRESSSRIALNNTDYHLSIGHTYKQILPDLPNSSSANDMSLTFGYTLNEQIKLNGGFTYDVDDASNNQWRFGGSYHRDCWSVAASIREEITPRPTGFTTDTSFSVQLNFIPFGGLGSGDTGE